MILIRNSSFRYFSHNLMFLKFYNFIKFTTVHRIEEILDIKLKINFDEFKITHFYINVIKF